MESGPKRAPGRKVVVRSKGMPRTTNRAAASVEPASANPVVWSTDRTGAPYKRLCAPELGPLMGLARPLRPGRDRPRRFERQGVE